MGPGGAARVQLTAVDLRGARLRGVQPWPRRLRLPRGPLARHPLHRVLRLARSRAAPGGRRTLGRVPPPERSAGPPHPRPSRRPAAPADRALDLGAAARVRRDGRPRGRHAAAAGARAPRRDSMSQGGGPRGRGSWGRGPGGRGPQARSDARSDSPLDAPEVIARPDLEAVLADEKTKELIEEYESEAKTRTLTGAWARGVTVLSVATTLFALYYAAAGAEIPLTHVVLVPTFRLFGQTITTPQIYVMLFLTAILVLTFILYPAHPRFLKRVSLIDLPLIVASIAIT